jgi:Asp-tRNA(Asn)/Glu-tRNA(Gln) amidotransferase A subunit family amidase
MDRDVASDVPNWEVLHEAIRWTAPFNLTGHPAISLPLRTTGLPVGVQLIGKLGHDEHLLDVAKWVEGVVLPIESPTS